MTESADELRATRLATVIHAVLELPWFFHTIPFVSPPFSSMFVWENRELQWGTRRIAMTSFGKRITWARVKVEQQ